MRTGPGRRTILAACAALALPRGLAAKGPRIRTANIVWPGADGTMLHGLMAIPVRAHGRQPALLVIGDAADADVAALVTGLADGGLIACAARGPATFAALGATIAWLAGNRYATGRVGLVARAGDMATIQPLLAAPPPALTVIVLLDVAEDAAPTSTVPLLALPPVPAPASAPVPAYPAPLPLAVFAFLKEHLR